MANNEEIIDSKFSWRNNALFINETFSDYKEESMKKELSLGKSIRERLFLRKRMQHKLRKDTPKSPTNNIGKYLSISKELYDKCKDFEVNTNQIKEILSCLKSDNLEEKYTGLISIRKLLCNDKPPVEIIFENNILPEIISFLDGSYSVEFIYEALWCLINISYGNEHESEKIKNQGGIEKIIDLLNNNMDDIKEMAIWCLDNISHDSLEIKNFLAKKKIIKALITMLSINNNEKIISHIVSVIKILIELYSEKKKMNFDVKKLINTISKLIIDHEYNQENKYIKYIFYDCCHILSYLTEKSNKFNSILLENGVIQYIIELLKNPYIEKEVHLFHLLLKIIGNIICGDANQTSQVLNNDIFSILKKHINNESTKIQKEVCWIISNIAADTQENLIRLYDNGFFPLLLKFIGSSDKSIRIEVVYALCNFTLLSDENYLGNLIVNGLLKAICDCIKEEEPKETMVCLEGLFNLLLFGDKYRSDGCNLIIEEIEKMGMIDILEKLQYHREERIYEKSLLIRMCSLCSQSL